MKVKWNSIDVFLQLQLNRLAQFCIWYCISHLPRKELSENVQNKFSSPPGIREFFSSRWCLFVWILGSSWFNYLFLAMAEVLHWSTQVHWASLSIIKLRFMNMTSKIKTTLKMKMTLKIKMTQTWRRPKKWGRPKKWRLPQK